VRARLEALRAAGAEVDEGPTLRFVARLLSRAEGLGAPARDQLLARAERRLADLEARFGAARAEAQARLAAVETVGGDPDGALAAAFARGAHADVLRRAPEALRRARDPGPAQDRRRLLRLAAQARARGIALPEGLGQVLEAGVDSDADARRLGDALARVLFRDAASQARSALAVARAADGVPPVHGPYNPQALVAETLALLARVSPAYLRATEVKPPSARRRRRP
jgi:hypothetical protein